MGKYRITSPDGASFEITAPEGATPEQVQQFAQQQFATMQPGRQGNAAGGGVGAGVKMGLRDPIDAGAQMLRRVVPESVGQAVDSFGDWLASKGLPVTPSSGVQGVDKIVRDTGEQYAADRKAAGRDGFDFARLAGNVVNPVNRVLPGSGALSKAKTVGQLATAGAAVGASSAALQPILDTANFWSEKAKQTAAGAAAGAVLTPLVAKGAEKIAGVARDVLRSGQQGPIVVGGISRADLDAAVANVLQSQGIKADEAPKVILDSVRNQVTEALSTGKQLNPAMALRKAQAESIGLTGDAALTVGQMSRDPIKFAQERNMSGVVINTPKGPGNPLATRFANQNQRLQGLFDNIGASQATDRVTAGQMLLDTFGAANARADQQVKAAYDAFRQSTGRELELPLQGLAQDYSETLRRFGDAVPGSVRKQFEGLGLLGGKQQKLLTIDGAEDLIKTINANTDPANKPAFRALGELRAAVQKAIAEGADAAPSGASAEAAALAKEARSTAADVFRTRREIPVMQAAADDVAPDKVIQRFLLNAPVREAEGAAQILRQNPEAMAQARAQVAALLKEAAFGQNMAGDKTIAAERFAKTLSQIGPQKLAVFFSPEEIVRLNLAAKVAAEINSVPAGATNAVNYSNSGSAVFNLLQKLGESPFVRQIPGARSLANQAGEIANERAINSAVQPAQAATNVKPEPPPELVRALRRLFAPAAVAGGAAAGSGF